MLFSTGYANAGTWTLPLDYPGAHSTMIYGVSGSNFVGTYTDASGANHGFLYNDNAWTTFDAPPDFTFMQVRGIDGSNIVGGYGERLGGAHGFIYDGSNWVTFDLPGATSTSITGIDESNIIGLADKQNFVYNLSTHDKTIIEKPGAASTYVHGIDGSNIVGYYTETVPNDPFSFIIHGFIYDGANWITLDMPGATQTRIWDIDGSNIVGWGFLYNMTTDTWTALDVPGARTTYAQAIDGDNIVGYYIDDTFHTHGFLYTIPEPATLLLLGLGAVILRRKPLKN